MRRLSLMVAVFLFGCAVSTACFGQTDAEKTALAELNRVHGTAYAWCDAAYKIALAEATYWSGRKLGHRAGYYAYGARNADGDFAGTWLRSKPHRNGIARDWKNGKTSGAVAIVGNTAYFAPSERVVAVRERTVTCADGSCSVQSTVRTASGVYWQRNGQTYAARQYMMPKVRNGIRRMFR
ncbi:MAG: hypothetical protein FWE67_04085 [Planctomycetaceae bacterium]|nr:hypothetical protein [Planctomycetaceae bacterium]